MGSENDRGRFAGASHQLAALEEVHVERVECGDLFALPDVPLGTLIGHRAGEVREALADSGVVVLIRL